MVINLISMMFFYWIWIVLVIGGMSLLMRILRLDRPREVKVVLQSTVRDE